MKYDLAEPRKQLDFAKNLERNKGVRNRKKSAIQ